ncbi:response regulator [Chloracidobacterium sp. MS 40/45]|uniref:response regulator n=1 Tax=Chloracidobacterium aggregatum TaxID=2851959 RepID=UPI001B8AC001|nr:response regulator [Chloracidobacterium aggregatum]QUW00807.1 response regulator [Chloracidobacterium sp. MS 40/45]
MKRVLLVDDDQAVLQIVSKWLGHYQETFTIITAEHGREALDILLRQPVDVVVTDLQMPVMDGFELIAHLLSEQMSVPIIIMTAMVVSAVENRLQGVGAFPVIRKPLSVTALHNLICNELDARQQGVIQGLTLPSFLQLLEAECKSCALRVTASGRVGYLYFSDGELFHAETGESSGEAAAYDILLWDAVKLQMAALPATPPPKTLHDRLMGLLMEAFRRRDEAEEARHRAGAAPHLPTQPAVEAGRMAAPQPPGDRQKVDGQSSPPVPATEHQATEAALKTAAVILTLADHLLASTVEASKVYALAPELSRRLASGDFPQQATRLLRLFDGQRTSGEIMANLPADQAAALTFLANGLKALDLLGEVSQPVPMHQPTQADPAATHAE